MIPSIKRFTQFKKSISENHNETENYMFFANISNIKRMCEEILEMDPSMVDSTLTDGHGWAVDHIATSKDDVEEVGGFLMNEVGQGVDDYNMQQPHFVPVSLNNHQEAKDFIREIIRKVNGGYRLYSHKGKNLGTFDTKAGAEKHEQEVNYFKHKK